MLPSGVCSRSTKEKSSINVVRLGDVIRAWLGVMRETSLKIPGDEWDNEVVSWVLPSLSCAGFGSQKQSQSMGQKRGRF